MAEFGDFDFALKFRKVIQEIVTEEVSKLRPRLQYAEVIAIDRVNLKCTVQYPGDSTQVDVRMGSVQPASVGQTVRISGPTGDKFIEEVLVISYTTVLANDAQTTADAAQTSADGKNKITYSLNVPGTTANAVGDIWWQKDDTGVLIGQWEGMGGTTWISRQLSHETIASIDTATITVGTLTGAQLSATAIDGKTITGPLIQSTATASRGVKIDSTGLKAYDGTGANTIAINSDGTASLTGTVAAHALSIDDNMAVHGVNNEFSTGSDVTLALGVTAPALPPTVVVDYPSIAMGDSASYFTAGRAYPDGGGVFVGGNYLILMSSGMIGYGVTWQENRVVTYSPAGAVISALNLNIANKYTWDSHTLGLTKIGTNFWTLTWRGNSSETYYRLESYDATTGVLGNSFNSGIPLTPSGLSYFADGSPALGTDGTNLLVAQCTSTTVTIKTIDPATGSVLSTYTAAHAIATGLVSVLVGSFDYGSTRYVISTWGGNTYTYTLSGTTLTLTGETFTTPNAETTSSLLWDGSNFQAITGGSYASAQSLALNRAYAMSAIKWTTESDVWWASYAWHEITPSTYSTTQGPRASFTMNKRARLTITTPAITAGSTPPVDSAILFIGRGATDPRRVDMWDSSATPSAGVRTFVPVPTFAGSNPVAANTFPAGVPATLTSGALRADGVTPKWTLAGDGTVDGMVPTGSIEMLGGVNVPAGWLSCNGSSVLRASYPALNAYWAAEPVPYPYGSVDSTHMTLPNFTNAFPRGNTLVASAGSDTHTHTTAATVPGHGHVINAHSHSLSGAGQARIDLENDAVYITRVGAGFTANIKGMTLPDSLWSGTVGNSAALQGNTDGSGAYWTNGQTGPGGGPDGSVAISGTANSQSNVPHNVGVNFIIKT